VYIKDFEKTAIIYRDRHISYRELIGSVEAFSKILEIDRGDRVLIFSENRPEWIYAFFAVWERSGTVVPIDFLSTPEEVAYILGDARPRLVFISNQNREILLQALDISGYRPDILVFEDIDFHPAHSRTMKSRKNGDDTAVILYTSGTTGRPKGVMLTHNNLDSNVYGIARLNLASKRDSIISMLPFHHSYPLMVTVLLPLFLGMTIVMVDKISSEEILRTLRDYKITIFMGVPRVFELLHRSILEEINRSFLARFLFLLSKKINRPAFGRVVFRRVHKALGGNIRYFVSGGARLDRDVVRDFKALGLLVIEGYGLTETSPIVSFNPPGGIRIGSVGLPIEGVQVKTENSEILVKGPNVMKGYLHQPEETREVLRNGWLYTGDLGYIDRDGYVYITGRKKDVIVLPSGKNINPEDIERQIQGISDLVKEVAVVEREGHLLALIYPDFEALSSRKITNVQEEFKWHVIATNEEAIKMKENVKFDKIREYVIQQIMKPIQQELEIKAAEKYKGKELTREEKLAIQQEVQQQMQAMTPEQVDVFMKRKYKAPVEIMVSQILKYIILKLDVKRVFNEGWKHGTISAHEIYWTGIVNDEPFIQAVNPLFFDYDRDSSADFIEDRDWAGLELWLTKSQVVTLFGDELTDEQIDTIYGNTINAPSEFTFSDSVSNDRVRVIHRTWKALKKIGFLSYLDINTGEIAETIVDEDYKENPNDINIVWEWIPEVYEGFKIGRDIYARLRPIPSQVKNIDNLYECKLPYYGGIYDADNSKPTSIIDRMKVYQYYYNVIMYRIEMLMASDKGKLLLMNINLVPNSMNINMQDWLYYSEALKIGWMNPNEEGNKNGTGDITNAAKEIDMSLVSDIQKYIELAKYIEQRAGAAVGITDEMKGRIGQYQAAKSTEQALTRGGYIVEPYFEMHNIIKRNALTGLMNNALLAYSNNDKRTLNFVLDDFSTEVINIDKDLLSMSSMALFVGDSTETAKVKDLINNLALTAMQNQRIELSDVVKTLRTDDLASTIEKLEEAEDKKRKQEQELANQKDKNAQELEAKKEAFLREQWEHDAKMIVLKEEERRKTELQKQAILAMGFDKEKDENNNGVPDTWEYAQKAIESDIKQRHQKLEENKFEHQKETDKEKLKLQYKQMKSKQAEKK
jgi:long-subunit acyl-CoA synthetase (AMP-forming)